MTMPNGRRAALPAGVLLALTTLLTLVVPMTAAHADARWCSSACNGKLPTTTVTLLNADTVKCINSATYLPGTYYPLYDQLNPNSRDPYLSIRHMYSSTCQTTWLRITNSKATGRKACAAFERRTVSPAYTANGSCPGAGTTIDTPMADDHDDQGRLINFGRVTETTVDNFSLYVDTDYY